MKLKSTTQTSDVICLTAFYLFDSLWNGEPIRLLGIRTGKLSDPDTPVQLSLFDLQKPQTQKQKNLDEALDQIRKRYGKDAIHRGF